MAYIKKATAEERAAYAATDPIYKLGYYAHGVRDVDGNKHVCAVEDLRGLGGQYDPTWELMAPDGYHFDVEFVHSKLCYGLQDVRDQANNLELKRCVSDVRCGCDHGG